MKTIIFLALALLTASANAADQQAAQAQSAATVVQVASTVLSCALNDQGQCAIGIAEAALERLPRHAESKSGWTFDSTLIHPTASFYKD